MQLQPVKRGTHEKVHNGEHSAAGNAGAHYTRVCDAGVDDARVSDTRVRDTRVRDTRVRDTRVRDTRVDDIAVRGVHLGLRWQRDAQYRQHAGADVAADPGANAAAGRAG